MSTCSMHQYPLSKHQQCQIPSPEVCDMPSAHHCIAITNHQSPIIAYPLLVTITSNVIMTMLTLTTVIVVSTKFFITCHM